jgi:hypothetical protein
LDPAERPVWSYGTRRRVVMDLVFAGIIAGFWKILGPWWRCTKCRHTWRSDGR